MLALQASILLIVFAFGLESTPADRGYLLRRPGLFARSLVAMFVVMPLLAVLLDSVFALRPAVEIALIALAVSPVPPLLPGKQGKAGGSSAYALDLMAGAALLAIVIVPLEIELLGRLFGRSFTMPLAGVVRIVIVMLILPLAAGFGMRALNAATAQRLVRPVRMVGTILLVVSVLALLSAVFPAAMQLVGGGTLIVMVAFIIVGMAVGHWMGGPRPEDSTVLALSTANRHPAIALAIATANFPDEPALPAAVVLYLIVAAIVALPYVARQRRTSAARD